MKSSTLVLFLMLLFAAGLRLWGVGFGLPWIQHIDEGGLIHTALFMAAEYGRPSVYVHGTVYPGLVAMFSGLYYWLGKMLGWFFSPDDFLVWYVRDPTTLVLFGRLLDVFFSLVTVGLLFWIGKKVYGWRVGLLAALFLTVSILHVKESHYVKPDVLSGLVALLLFEVSYRIVKRGAFTDYIWAGLLFGLALGVKFTLLLALPMILLAHVLRRKGRGKNIFLSLFNRHLFVFFALAVVMFFLVAPYVFIDFRFFLRDWVRFGNSLLLPRGDPHSPLWYYLFSYLKEGLGLGVWLLTILGILVVGWRRRIEDVLLVSFPFVFLATVDFWSKEHAQRYVLPILPLFVLLSGIGGDWIVSKWRGKQLYQKLLYWIFLVIILWQPLERSIKFDFLITKPQTGVLLTDWIEKNIPYGSTMAIDGRLRAYYPGSSGPYVYPTSADFSAELEKIPSDQGMGRYLKAIAKSREGKGGYAILATPNLAYVYNLEKEIYDLEGFPRLGSVDYYLGKGVEYIVTSDWSQPKFPIRYAWSEVFRNSLVEHYDLIARFEPTVRFQDEYHLVRLDYQALDQVNIFDRDAVFGSVISLYRRKG